MNTAIGSQKLVLNYRGQRIELKSSARRFHLGWDFINQLVIKHKQVSRKHAEIKFQDGRFILTDYSMNGTYLSSESQERLWVFHQPWPLPQQGVMSLGDKPDDQNPDLIQYQLVSDEVEAEE